MEPGGRNDDIKVGVFRFCNELCGFNYTLYVCDIMCRIEVHLLFEEAFKNRLPLVNRMVSIRFLCFIHKIKYVHSVRHESSVQNGP